MTALAEVVGQSLADIGCGSGLFGYMARHAWSGTRSWHEGTCSQPMELIGVDWSENTIERLRCNNPYDRLILASSNRLPIDDLSVDTAVCLENLEHLLPCDVISALCELKRIARRKVVVTTPAPWTVLNRAFLAAEILAAEDDDRPLPYGEFINLVGNLHKSWLDSKRMEDAGFSCSRNRLGVPKVVAGSIVYTGLRDEIDPSRITDVGGIDAATYPQDDGRADWRGEYLEWLKASASMRAPESAPFLRRVSIVLKGLKDGLKSFDG